MNPFRSNVLDPPASIDQPPKTERPERHRHYRDKRKKCPYCLFDLTDYDPKELGKVCPLCRHQILDHLITIPIYEFTRAQQWDHLANEMEYIWDGEQRDVNSYVETMGGFYNPDFSDAKERLLRMFLEKNAVQMLREEYLEATAEMDLLIVFSLEGFRGGKGEMARRLYAGRQWRFIARRLSMTVTNEREMAYFQMGLIQDTPWGCLGEPGEKEKLLAPLEERYRRLSWEQENLGA